MLNIAFNGESAGLRTLLPIKRLDRIIPYDVNMKPNKLYNTFYRRQKVNLQRTIHRHQAGLRRPKLSLWNQTEVEMKICTVAKSRADVEHRTCREEIKCWFITSGRISGRYLGLVYESVMP